MRSICVLAALCACGGGTVGPHHAVSGRIGDATFSIPDGWWIEQRADRVTIQDPERAVRLEIALARGDARTALHSTELDEPPPRDGWDAVAEVDYEVPAPRASHGSWRRFRDTGYVILVEGDRAALDRRDAQIETIVGSLRPAGMKPDALVGPPRVLDAVAIDAFAERARNTLSVPGAAIAVIVDGRVVYERALGVRLLGDPAPITPDTRFLIASITKPVTTFMQAALVDAGVVRWDTPVTKILPSFALADDAFTRELLLWHMSCACTGMPRQDLEGLMEWDHVTAEDRIAVMKTMKPTTKLGETFQYSNPMVAAGGFIAGHAFAPDKPLGEAYAAAMQAKVFDPIGMTSSTFDFATVERGEHARPHALAIDGTTRAMPLSIERAVIPIAPAGALWTTLRDFERYVQTELANGVSPDGKRVVSAANMKERTTMRVRSDETSGYALGMDVGTYEGLRVNEHDGGAFGFGTTMFMLPDQHVGIIIFTNIRNGNPKAQLPFNSAVKRFILEQLFAARPLADKQLAYYAKLRTSTPHALDPDRSWIAPLVGVYHHPTLGTLEIRATATGAELDAGEWRTATDRVVDPDGTVNLVNLDPPFAGGKFQVVGGAIVITYGQTTYTFTR